MTTKELIALVEELTKPTPREEIKWRVGPTNDEKTRCGVLAYVDARYIQERLNQAFGPLGWDLTWEPCAAPDGWVAAKVRLTIPQQQPELGWSGCIKEDVGYQQTGERGPDQEPYKGAVSDGLKRCAVHLGICHDLYSTEMVWMPYDKQRKTYVGTADDVWAVVDGKQPQAAPQRAQSPGPAHVDNRAPKTPPGGSSAARTASANGWASQVMQQHGGACPSCRADLRYYPPEGDRSGAIACTNRACQGGALRKDAHNQPDGKKHYGWRAWEPKRDAQDLHEAQSTANSIRPEVQQSMAEADLRGELIQTIIGIAGELDYGKQGMHLENSVKKHTGKESLEECSLEELRSYLALLSAKLDEQANEAERPGPGEHQPLGQGPD